MNGEQIREILKNEELSHYNFLGEHALESDEIAIDYDTSIQKWVVYATDERASKVSSVYFINESDALENFIKRVRLGKKILNY